MAWTIKFADGAIKELKKIDKQGQKEIQRDLKERIASDEDPRRFGKALSKELTGYWRYRISNYRIICNIQDKDVVVLVVRVGHQKNIYD